MKRSIFLSIIFFSFVAEANLRFSPWSLNFTTVDLNRPHFEISYTSLYNDSFDTINNVYISDDCFSHFYVTNNCFFLNPNQACSISVEYSPTQEGNHSCSISASGGGFYDRLRVSGRAKR